VVFAALALKRPHVLILDECTNHLDLESVDALIRALQVFPGGVVLVSHDARLITSLDCEIWVCEGGLVGGDGMEGTGIRVEKRGFEFYRLDLLRQIARRQAAAERLAEQKALRRKQERELTLQRAQEKTQRVKKLQG
jgi:ABC-type multidrug transport system ATPase subunit